MTKLSLKTQLAHNFKAALEDCGVSCSDLGRLTNCHPNTWSNRTKGGKSGTDLKVEDLIVAAQALQVSPAWLITRVVDPPPVDDRYTLILKELKRIRQVLRQSSGSQDRSCR